MIDICKDLNEQQQHAVRTAVNTVVAAGAGSGKTKVLSRRYVYLVTEQNCHVENILALTFTEKAAAEMNRRIYRELQSVYMQSDDAVQRQRAGTALESFFKAQIMTIDSFCHKIAVTACRRFGISPDFSINLAESKRLAYNLSLDFFLEHRADPNLQYLLSDKPITDFITGFFVKILNEYVTVSHPIDFAASLQKQLVAAEALFLDCRTHVLNTLESIASYFNISDAFIGAVKAKYEKLPECPLTFGDERVASFLEALHELCSIKKNIGARNEEVKACKALCSELSEQYGTLQGLYRFYEHKEDIEKIYALCSMLQERFIIEKKRRSILHFDDIAQLAVDALINDSSLRLFYKKNIKHIMIDEFQDNNSLQRDLLFLLAEKEGGTAQSIPAPNELEPDKLFFVGDEKQSIYAFRGADVSVFRSLSKDLQQSGSSGSINLQINYRSEPELLAFFNSVFMRVFYSQEHQCETGTIPPFEAECIPILSRAAVPDLMPAVDIIFIDKKRFPKQTDTDEFLLTPFECEAYELAKKIAELHTEQYLIYDDTLQSTRSCTWSDFAVLMRASTHQAVYERFFRLFKIPYISIQQKGLFNDAPLHDLYAILRLAVYPHDRAVYVQVLRSPFVRLNDRSVTRLLLDSVKGSAAPFDPACADTLIAEDRQYFLRACALFERILNAVKTKSNAELVTMLWYDEGYRYVLLTEPRYHRYLELYDYLFALAVQADEAGEGLSAFIDKLTSYIHGDEKIEDMEIPLEHSLDAVKIMTVHKSKGLEFPIVCIPDCGNEGKSEKKEGTVFLHKDLGPVIHLPQEKKTDAGTSIFFEQLRQEANAKHLAETKRLFYVAVTRAKVRLLMSGVQETDCSAEEMPEEPRTMEEIRNVLKQPKKEEQNRSFFQLLLPVLQRDAGVRFTEVLPLPSSVMQRPSDAVQDYQNAAVRTQYRQAQEKNYPLAKPRIIPATQFEKDMQYLHLSGERFFRQNEAEKRQAVESAFSTFPGTVIEVAEQGKEAYKNERVDEVYPTKQVELAGASGSKEERSPDVCTADSAGIDGTDYDTLSSSEFGSAVHKALEECFLNRPYTAPTRYDKEVATLCDAFLSSPLGKKALAAPFRKTEYGFLTWYEGQLVIGQIDLLFEDEEGIYIIDYKTDTYINPEQHRRQLLIYKTAVENFYKMKGFGCGCGGSGSAVGDMCARTKASCSAAANSCACKPVKTFLFYLRSAAAVEIKT